jgi:hypothetical protein
VTQARRIELERLGHALNDSDTIAAPNQLIPAVRFRSADTYGYQRIHPGGNSLDDLDLLSYCCPAKCRLEMGDMVAASAQAPRGGRHRRCLSTFFAIKHHDPWHDPLATSESSLPRHLIHYQATAMIHGMIHGASRNVFWRLHRDDALCARADQLLPGPDRSEQEGARRRAH